MITSWKLIIKCLSIFLCFCSMGIFVPCSLMAGDGDNMSLAADPTSIPADGLSTTNITTIVDHNGIVLSGVTLTFTITSGGSGAKFQSGSNTITTYSDAVGGSTVVLYSDTVPGSATIKCVASGFGSNPDATPPIVNQAFAATRFVDVYFTGPGPTNSIVLSAVPTSVPADNLTPSIITAQLYDQYGTQIIKPGISLTFNIEDGVGHFSNGSTSTEIAVSTDATGTALALVYSSVAGTADIAATISDSSDPVASNHVFVTFTGGSIVSRIVLSASPTSIVADNLASSTITAKLYGQDDVQIQKPGIPVDFKIVSGVGHFSNNIRTMTASTDVVGTATALVYSEDIGSAEIIASIENSEADCTSIFVRFTAPTPSPTPQPTPEPSYLDSVVLTVQNPTVFVGDTTLTPAITAQLFDQYGKSLSKPGVPVAFATDFALFSNGLTKITVATDSSGKATAFLYASAECIATINATATDGPISVPAIAVYVNFIGSNPTADIVLSLDCNGSCDTSSFFTITATLYDKYGKIVSSGVPVAFTTTVGYFSNNLSSITAYTNSAGVASVVFYSGGQFGTAKISVSSNGITRYIDVVCSGGWPPADIVLSLDCNGSCDNSSYFTITATLYDKYGETVSSGVPVAFTTTVGYFSNNLSSITAYTNSAGVASVVFYSGGQFGTAKISASSNGITRYIDVVCSGGWPPADIVLLLNCDGSCDNSSYFTITATLYDKFGDTVSSGVSVAFETTLGYFSNKFSSITTYTNSAGVASVIFYSGGVAGLAQISASSNGVTRYLDVQCPGVRSPEFIYLSTPLSWVPADGSYLGISATILDNTVQPVPAGTLVTFSSTLGVFENGTSNYLVLTPDDSGKITVHLRATNSSSVGSALIACTSGIASQFITVNILKLEYETEPNNEMVLADSICFNHVFLGQLSSPYEEDWYTFNLSQSSRIGINFIATAISAFAGDCTSSTTVGTYRVDIRDVYNNIIMSYQNVDCTLNNGIWETGVIPAGTYYIVVFCPRLPDTSHYLSAPYYLFAFDNFYFPCGESDKFVNAASFTLKDSAYHLYVPIIDATSFLWAELLYDPVSTTNVMLRLKDYGEITDIGNYRSCNLPILSLEAGNYVLHIPILMIDGVSYRVDLIYVPTTDGQIWFMLSGFWLN